MFIYFLPHKSIIKSKKIKCQKKKYCQIKKLVAKKFQLPKKKSINTSLFHHMTYMSLVVPLSFLRRRKKKK